MAQEIIPASFDLNLNPFFTAFASGLFEPGSDL